MTRVSHHGALTSRFSVQMRKVEEGVEKGLDDVAPRPGEIPVAGVDGFLQVADARQGRAGGAELIQGRKIRLHAVEREKLLAAALFRVAGGVKSEHGDNVIQERHDTWPPQPGDAGA